MNDHKSETMTITSKELTKTGTTQDNKPYTLTSYGFKTAAGSSLYATTFDKYEYKIGDRVVVDYVEKPNPNGKYPYRNIKSMMRAVDMVPGTADAKPVIPSEAWLEQFIRAFRDKVQPSDWSANYFVGAALRTWDKDRYAVLVSAYDKHVMCKQEDGTGN